MQLKDLDAKVCKKQEENKGRGWWKSLKQVTDIGFKLNSHDEIASNMLSVKSRLKLRKLIVFIRIFFSFRKNRWIVARDGKGKFWEVKLPEFPSQPFQKRKIENEGLRLVEKSERRH